MFLRASARTAAKIRTNFNTNSGKATKQLGRLAPNLAHMCTFMWEWIYAKQIAPRGTRGQLGFLGGIYINSNMSYFRRDDLSIFIPHVIETLFIEVKLNKTKSIIVGVIYRPNSQPRADMDIFTTELADITAKINNENKESYNMGDFNIDLLKFQSHEKTKYFIESMLTTGYLPVITKPTRVTDHSATLIDHIYSNSKSLNYKSGIVITDVADHFGTFYVSRKKHISQYRTINIFDK